MSNPIVNWWRSRQFRGALQKGNLKKAEKLLQEIERSGARLSGIEKLFRDRQKLDRYLVRYKQQAIALRQEVVQLQRDRVYLPQNETLIAYIEREFKLHRCDSSLLQCTGICDRLFDDFEANLANLVREEINKIPTPKRDLELEAAIVDIEKLKHGIDPDYNLRLTPHVYLMKYFLENVYCSYLTWFLIYKAGLLPVKFNLLDIAAGPGTVACGLALFLYGCTGFIKMPQTHISYYSLEKQATLQYRGLQFWRRYLELQPQTANTYFQFDTTDIFSYIQQPKKLPQKFFDFITIFHCFFSDPKSREKSYQAYRKIFAETLRYGGYVLLVVQGRKLFGFYDRQPQEDIRLEENIIGQFVSDLGLQLEWYEYLSSTGKRKPCGGAEFGKFARESLPLQKFMSSMNRQYLGLSFDSNYAIDDYAILAKRSSP